MKAKRVKVDGPINRGFGVYKKENYKCGICHTKMHYAKLKTIILTEGILFRVCIKKCMTPTIRKELTEYFSRSAYRVLTFDS